MPASGSRRPPPPLSRRTRRRASRTRRWPALRQSTSLGCTRSPLQPTAPTGGGDIVVCGRHRGDPERYRLPLRSDGFDPDGNAESVSRERNRLMEGGESGSGACSASGAGGWTGCFIQGVRHEQQQHGYR